MQFAARSTFVPFTWRSDEYKNVLCLEQGASVEISSSVL